MTWLATANSTSMVYEIRRICTAFLRKLCYLLLHDYYYLIDCGIQLSHVLPGYSPKTQNKMLFFATPSLKSDWKWQMIHSVASYLALFQTELGLNVTKVAGNSTSDCKLCLVKSFSFYKSYLASSGHIVLIQIDSGTIAELQNLY